MARELPPTKQATLTRNLFAMIARITHIIAFALGCFWMNFALVAEAQAADEYKVKAAYLYNFALYAEWPKEVEGDEDKPFVIGVLGKNPFAGALNLVAKNKTIRNKKIVVHYFDSPDDFKPCQMLFIPEESVNGAKATTPEERLKDVMDKAKKASALIVCESKGLAKKGASVNFFIDSNNRIKFEINTEAAKRAGLKLNSKLLQLGKIVEE